MTITENELIVESPLELEAEMCRYNCQTKEDLENVLWFDYNVILVIAYEHSI